MIEKARVLVVCVHNAARSRMAEAVLLEQRARPRCKLAKSRQMRDEMDARIRAWLQVTERAGSTR